MTGAPLMLICQWRERAPLVTLSRGLGSSRSLCLWQFTTRKQRDNQQPSLSNCKALLTWRRRDPLSDVLKGPGSC